LLHLPPGFDPDDPLPVVFSFHGFASRPEGQEDISRWNEIADGEGFIVIYPQGTSFPLRWNTRSSSADTVDDVQFFRDIIDDLAGILTLDRDRIFVTGLSNGGAMTHRLACEVADLIAAAGTVAAPISDLPGGCQPSRPVPLIAFHGTADPIVSYNGGSVSFTSRDRDGELYPHAFGYQPAEVWVRDWAVLNGCDTTPETFSHAEDVLGARYSGCEEDAEVILYTIDGGGHTWPGGARLPRLITGETSSQIQASERMWAFFLEHSSPTTLAE
jgi:polyhydroxybutyrate depolymerase